MTDIVERLRDRECKFCDEAADEIERLLGVCKDKTTLLREAYAQNERLRAEAEKIANISLHQRADLMAEIERLRAGAEDTAWEDRCGLGPIREA